MNVSSRIKKYLLDIENLWASMTKVSL